MKKYILLVTFCIVAFCALGQSAKVSLDSSKILIGDQLKMNVELECTEEGVLFPILTDTCIPNIEILSKTNIDTTKENGKIKYHQQLTITSFESGTHIIPPLTFYTADSTFLAMTDMQTLQVNTVKVDTTKAIKDIAKPLREPWKFKEVIPYVLYILLAAIVIAAIIFLIVKLSRRKKKSETPVKQKPSEPADVIAMRDLDALWQQRLCEKGHVKEYYSRLSDICRTYIDNRWEVSTMEMVSSEIVECLQNLGINRNDINNMKELLYASDMVKFAKADPLPNENSSVYQLAVDFVKNTKKTIEIKEN